MANLSLKIAYQNVRGLRTKSNEFFSKTISCSYDVVCLTETWLNNSFYSNEFFSDDFVIYRKDRDSVTTGRSRGGGVAVAVRRELCSTPTTDAPPGLIGAEELWVSIPFTPGNSTRAPTGSQLHCDAAATRATVPIHPNGPSRLHIICTYIPHGPNHTNRLTSFFDSVYNFMVLYPDDMFLILGDFNVTNGVWVKNLDSNSMSIVSNENELASNIADFMNLAQLNQYNSVLNENLRLLDLVFSNSYIQISRSSSPLTSEDSHHPAIDIDLRIEHVEPFLNNPQSSYFA